MPRPRRSTLMMPRSGGRQFVRCWKRTWGDPGTTWPSAVPLSDCARSWQTASGLAPGGGGG
jgi:hypothetical protein